MGLLDDAIKEHLDLKRRRGADPSEIAREEAEALGPVRREAQAPTPAEAPEAREALASEHAEPPGLEDPGAAYADDPPADLDPPLPAQRPAVHDEPYAPPEDESATPPHGDPLLHQATHEFSVDEVDEALGRPADAPDPASRDVVPADEEGDGEAEDVLEETPEFLQETPEHDRLWFEQKPPKDFDF
jgi:hypothetical protein